MNTHPTLIGVDGGGTSCRFALRHNGELFQVHGGPANASTDLDGAIETLCNGLSALAAEAKLPLAALKQTPTAMGIAGAIDAEIADRIAAALPQKHVWIGDDRRTAMAGALDEHDGCVIGIGTGSFFGRRNDGTDRLIGGWGFTLGDEASGAVLVRQSLSATLEVHDGLRAATPLTDALMQRFHSPAGIIAFATNAHPGALAALAPLVTRAAEAGDVVGLDLMNGGAAHIATMLRHLGWQPGLRVCPLGGIAPHYAPYLPSDIAADLAEPEGSALNGALAMAAKMAKVP